MRAVDVKVRASCAALGFTAFWSACKFGPYALTGSLSILAEALPGAGKFHVVGEGGDGPIVRLVLKESSESR